MRYIKELFEFSSEIIIIAIFIAITSIITYALEISVGWRIIAILTVGFLVAIILERRRRTKNKEVRRQ